MNEHPEFAIDLDKIIASKSKGRKLPAFLVRWMKRLLHVDFLNEYFTQGYVGVDFCTNAIKYLDVTLDVRGFDKFDTSGQTKYTFVSNHPLGGIDGVALGGIVGEAFGGHVRYLVNDLLMNLKGLAPLCVPVNVMGKGQSRDLADNIDEAFRSEDQMVMFPGKLCSRKIDGKIQDLPWGKAFIRKSVMTGRQVVPVHFVAENSKRFYRVANWCKRLGIKFNLAMLLLPDEMYKARHSTFKVIFGDPIPPETFDKSRSAYEWAQWVRETVFTL